MKVLAVFMTVLLLVTGVDLCNYLDRCDNRASTELEQSGNGKHTDEAPCSPFCHCARCPFSIILPSILKVSSVSSTQNEKFDTYSASQPVQVISSIWQPPKKSIRFS